MSKTQIQLSKEMANWLRRIAAQMGIGKTYDDAVRKLKKERKNNGS